MAQVEIYTRDYCYYCHAAKELLSRKAVAFTEINITGRPELRVEMLNRANGRTTVPQIFVGTIHVGGCDDLYALEASGRLDPLLDARGRAGMTHRERPRSVSASSRCVPAATRATISAAATRLIEQAKSGGADYVLTPEMTNVMEIDRERLFATIVPEEQDASLATFRELARALGLYVHVGSLAIKVSPDKAANRSFLIDPRGEIVARYDKIHMFDVDLKGGESYRESRNFRAGDLAVVVDLPWGRLGLTICYDLRFPALYRALAEAGASFLTIPSAFTRQTGEAHWHVLMRARAIETGSYVFAAAQGGKHENGRETYGHSVVIDPWGRVVAEGDTEPGVVFADIDPAEVAAARGAHSLARARPAVRDGRADGGAGPPSRRAELRVIRYALVCERRHAFESWFAGFGRLRQAGRRTGS